MLDSSKPAVEVAVLGTVFARIAIYHIVFTIAMWFLFEPLGIPVGLVLVYSEISIALLGISVIMAAVALFCGVFTGTLGETWEALLK